MGAGGAGDGDGLGAGGERVGREGTRVVQLVPLALPSTSMVWFRVPQFWVSSRMTRLTGEAWVRWRVRVAVRAVACQ